MFTNEEQSLLDEEVTKASSSAAAVKPASSSGTNPGTAVPNGGNKTQQNLSPHRKIFNQVITSKSVFLWLPPVSLYILK